MEDFVLLWIFLIQYFLSQSREQLVPQLFCRLHCSLVGEYVQPLTVSILVFKYAPVFFISDVANKLTDFCMLMGGHLKPGQHFKVTVLPYYGTQEKGCDIILNLIQNAIDLSNITAIIRNERELSNST